MKEKQENAFLLEGEAPRIIEYVQLVVALLCESGSRALRNDGQLASSLGS